MLPLPSILPEPIICIEVSDKNTFSYTPSNETLNELPFYFNLSSHCKYVTLEYYQNSRKLVHFIKKIKDIISKYNDL